MYFCLIMTIWIDMGDMVLYKIRSYTGVNFYLQKVTWFSLCLLCNSIVLSIIINLDFNRLSFKETVAEGGKCSFVATNHQKTIL